VNNSTSSLRIVVAGYIVGGPLGGLVWHHLQYVLGLKAMGHDVLFVEDSDDYPSCYNPETNEVSTDPAYGIKFINYIFNYFSLGSRWAYFHASSCSWMGCPENEVRSFCRSADIFLNLSGINPVRTIMDDIPLKVFLDTDPVFTQIRNLQDEGRKRLTERHNRFFTYGENFRKPGCTIPDDGFPWQPTRQPVVIDLWFGKKGSIEAPWTTVMQWDSYKVRTINGQPFGMKSASFDPYLQLPQCVTDQMELAIGSATAPLALLSANGWVVRDPLSVTRSADSYRQFIQESKGEWSIAKHGYVVTCSGWFSERSCNYLASGRPVIVQDTGFSNFLPTGAGLLCFSNMKEAIECIDQVNQNYERQCTSAQSIAAAYFHYCKVLSDLLEACFSDSSNMSTKQQQGQIVGTYNSMGSLATGQQE
jgi:hypothetical protein